MGRLHVTDILPRNLNILPRFCIRKQFRAWLPLIHTFIL